MKAMAFVYRHLLVPAGRPLLKRTEAEAILARLRGSPRLVVQLLYGAGLRLREALQLRVKDLDFARGVIVVREQKCGGDRVTSLPPTLASDLREHLEHVRSLHEKDLARGFGRVLLPASVDRRFTNADRAWVWQWAFPAATRYVDLAAQTQRRNHLHESAVQRAVHAAAAEVVPGKKVTCHTFRHTFAMQMARNGHDLRTLQEILGQRPMKSVSAREVVAMTSRT